MSASYWCGASLYVRTSLNWSCFCIQWIGSGFSFSRTFLLGLKFRHEGVYLALIFDVSNSKLLLVKVSIWISFLTFENNNSFVRDAIKKAVSQSSVRANPSRQLHLKVNNWNTKARCEICSKLTIKTLERRQWRILHSEHILHLVLVFPLLTLSRYMPAENVSAASANLASRFNFVELQAISAIGYLCLSTKLNNI